MRVACLIDSLGSGGAQRQLCTLAVLFKQAGVEVSVVTHHDIPFFLPLLEAAGVPHVGIPARSRLSRIVAIRRALRRGNQDAVLAFLEGPSVYAELAGLPRRRWGLVVSERLAIPRMVRRVARWQRLMH